MYRASIGRGVADVYSCYAIGSYSVTRGVVRAIAYGLSYEIGISAVRFFRGFYIVEGFGVECGQVTRLLGFGVLAIVLAGQGEQVGGVEGLRRSFYCLYEGI